MEALGNVNILFQSGPEVDPYFSILMPDPSVGWRRARFLSRNFADFFQPWGSTASATRSNRADISEAKLSRPPILHELESSEFNTRV
jgi:hypothetical protein